MCKQQRKLRWHRCKDKHSACDGDSSAQRWFQILLSGLVADRAFVFLNPGHSGGATSELSQMLRNLGAEKSQQTL